MLGMRSMAAAPRCLGRAARPLTAVSTRGTQVRVAAAAADKDPLELAANAKGQTTKSSESSGPKTYENANIGASRLAVRLLPASSQRAARMLAMGSTYVCRYTLHASWDHARRSAAHSRSMNTMIRASSLPALGRFGVRLQCSH